MYFDYEKLADLLERTQAFLEDRPSTLTDPEKELINTLLVALHEVRRFNHPKVMKDLGQDAPLEKLPHNVHFKYIDLIKKANAIRITQERTISFIVDEGEQGSNETTEESKRYVFDVPNQGNYALYTYFLSAGTATHPILRIKHVSPDGKVTFIHGMIKEDVLKQYGEFPSTIKRTIRSLEKAIVEDRLEGVGVDRRFRSAYDALKDLFQESVEEDEQIAQKNVALEPKADFAMNVNATTVRRALTPGEMVDPYAIRPETVPVPSNAVIDELTLKQRLAIEGIPEEVVRTRATREGITFQTAAIAAMDDKARDKASIANNGGIDFDRSKMQMNVRKEGDGVQMQFDAAMIARIKREGFDGIEFNIQTIIPVTNLPLLLGM